MMSERHQLGIKCPKCSSKALDIGGTTQTLMAAPPPYSDEEGFVHYPKNPNIYMTSYRCRKCGHSFEKSEKA